MAEKKASKAAAVIDIGSNRIKMHISQLRKGSIQDLERLEIPLHLGREVFHSGKISYESFLELSKILNGFSAEMKSCGVTQYRMVATTALREAQNRAYIADMLRIQNGLDLTILDEDEEKSLIYFQAFSILAQNGLLPTNALLSYIGTGNTGIALCRGNMVAFAQTLPVGTLKLQDLFGDSPIQSPGFSEMLQEYLTVLFRQLDFFYSSKKSEQLIAAGTEPEELARICSAPQENGLYRVKTADLCALSRQMEGMTPQKIGFKFNVSEEHAASLMMACAILQQPLASLSAEEVWVPHAELPDAVMRTLLIPGEAAAYSRELRKGSVACAKEIAAQFNPNDAHREFVLETACLLFDKMKTLHGLGRADRLLLELSALLHECGYHVNSSTHSESTFSLIRSLRLYGLCARDNLLVAQIARQEIQSAPVSTDADFMLLSEAERLLVSKLSAIFRLANALDCSKKQKLCDFKIKIEENELRITACANGNAALESWAFAQCSGFFEEVFGLKPTLLIKANNSFF